MRRSGALVTALLLAVPSAGVPQTSSSAAGIVGDWEGWANLANDWPGHPCRYEGAKEEASVRLAISATAEGLRGSVAIDLAATDGSGCPPLRKRHLVTEVVLGEGIVSLTDSGGHDWSLSFRQGGRVLRGLLAWQQGGPEEPLAEGFAFADGTKPGSRLSGEVRLRKVEAGAETGAGETAAAAAAGVETGTKARETIGAGGHLGNLGTVLGATAVGLGALYGVNKLGQGTSDEGTVTCSPRVCVVGAPGEPCFCEGNVVSGAECGETEAGVEIGGMCDGIAFPCQATLSCNSGICEDRFGRCPF